jgi:hypothetical protein
MQTTYATSVGMFHNRFLEIWRYCMSIIMTIIYPGDNYAMPPYSKLPHIRQPNFKISRSIHA